ncbi:MAG: hypothetical protein ACMUIP_07730 [bacterium]
MCGSTAKPIIFWLFFSIMIMLAQSHPAGAYQMDLAILPLYVSENPEIVGMGGFNLMREGERTDLYHPARLVYEKKNYLSVSYGYENVLNNDGSDWDNILIKSEESKYTGIFNVVREGMIQKITLAAQYADDKARGDGDYTRDDFKLDYNKTIRRTLVSCGIHAGERFSFGAGFEEYDNTTSLFWEAELRNPPTFNVGLRNFSREFDLDFTIEKDGTQGRIPLQYSEDVFEIMCTLYLHKRLTAHFVIDGKHKHRKKFGLHGMVSGNFSLIYCREYGRFGYHQDIFVNGSESGHNNGDADYSLWSAGMQFKIAQKTIYHVTIKKYDFSSKSAGLVEGDAILDFWENLLAGKRYFNYTIGLDSTQYHIGAESKWTDTLTMRGGLQYIAVKPEGCIDDWTPFPFTGLGRLDEHSKALSYSKITMGVLALGLSYTIKDFEITYGLAQLIPLSKEKKEEEAEISDVEDDGKSTLDWDDVKDVWETIKDNPGGTLHVLEVRWYF